MHVLSVIHQLCGEPNAVCQIYIEWTCSQDFMPLINHIYSPNCFSALVEGTVVCMRNNQIESPFHNTITVNINDCLTSAFRK